MEELWIFGVEPARKKNQMVIYIGTDTVKRYVAKLQHAIRKMSPNSVEVMVRKILKIEDDEEGWLPEGMLMVVHNYAKQLCPDAEALKTQLADLLAGQKDVSDIRCVENAIGDDLFGGRPCYHHKSGELRPLLWLDSYPVRREP